MRVPAQASAIDPPSALRCGWVPWRLLVAAAGFGALGLASSPAGASVDPQTTLEMPPPETPPQDRPPSERLPPERLPPERHSAGTLGGASGLGASAPRDPFLEGPYGDYLRSDSRPGASVVSLGPGSNAGSSLGGSLDIALPSIHGRVTPEAFATAARSSRSEALGRAAEQAAVDYGLASLRASRRGAPGEDLVHLAIGFRLLALDRGHDTQVVDSLIERLAMAYARAGSSGENVSPVGSVAGQVPASPPRIAKLLRRAARRGVSRALTEAASPVDGTWRFREPRPSAPPSIVRAFASALAPVRGSVIGPPTDAGAPAGLPRAIYAAALDGQGALELVTGPQESPRLLRAEPWARRCDEAESAGRLLVGEPPRCVSAEGARWLVWEVSGQALRMPRRQLRDAETLDDLASAQGRALALAHRRVGMVPLERETVARLPSRLAALARDGAQTIEQAWRERTQTMHFVPGSLR